ncbi:MAG: HD domain-containing protein [Bacillota bacterium]
MINEIIKNYTREECIKTNNVFGTGFFEDHILLVADYSKRLAERISADSEIVELASYLHDIAAVQDISSLAKHNLLSAEIAEKILCKWKYNDEKIDSVKKTIVSHMSPLKLSEASAEEVCLSNADAMSQITRPVFWLYFVFSVRKLSYEDGRKWLIQRVENNWKALVEPAKEIIEKEYLNVKEILNY